MHAPRFKPSPLILALLAGLNGLQANAQTQAAPAPAPAASAVPAEAEVSLSAVVVTAQKREERLQEVPVAITVLGGDKLGKSDGILTGNDITQFIPNAQASATDGRTRPRWFLRGIGTNETAASTVSPIGIYADDVYLNNVYIQGFPLFDTQRVEVLRGPQGTLWGKNTTGGAIHYISKQPTFKNDNYARIGLGENSERTVQGAVNGTLVDGVLAARISFYDEKRDGWVRNTVTNGRDGAVADTAVRAQLRWLVNEDIDAVFALKARKLNGDKSPSFYVIDPLQTVKNPLYTGPLKGRHEIAQAGEFSEDLDSDGGSLRVNWRVGDLTLTSITAHDTGERVLNTGSPIALDVSRSRLTSNSRQTTQEFRLASPKYKSYDWIVGTFYFNESLRSGTAARSDAVAGASSTNPANASPKKFELTDYNQDTESYAVFAAGTFRFDERYSIGAGVRKSWEKKSFDLGYAKAPGAATFTGNTQWWLPAGVSSLGATALSTESKSWDEVTYDITPQVKINANANAYLRYAHGFRAGGFVVSNTNTITRLDPETLNATELGLKTQWLDGALTFNTAVFNYDYSNIIVGVLLPVPGSNPPTTQQVQENAAKGYSRGAEFELAYAPSRRWRVGANLGLLKTKYQNYESTASGQSINATGNRFTRAPQLSWGLDGEYNFPLAIGGSLGVGGDISWRSKQYFNAVDQSTPTLEQKSYELANVRIFYRTTDGKTEISAFVRNVTDSLYSKLATNTTAGVTREVYGLPRSYGVAASLRF